MSARLPARALVGVVAALAFPFSSVSGTAMAEGIASEEPAPSSCASTGDPEYYSFELERTDKLPSVRVSSGQASVSSPPTPFGLAVTRDGTIAHHVEVSVSGDAAPDEGVLVAWAADPNLERVVRVGAVSGGEPASGRITLNKFMIFVTLERVDDRSADRWQGPVILVGRSRSARLQSMASHGTFEPEPC